VDYQTRIRVIEKERDDLEDEFLKLDAKVSPQSKAQAPAAPATAELFAKANALEERWYNQLKSAPIVNSPSWLFERSESLQEAYSHF